MLGKEFYSLLGPEEKFFPGYLMLLNTLCEGNGDIVTRELMSDYSERFPYTQILNIRTRSRPISRAGEVQLVVPMTAQVSDIEQGIKQVLENKATTLCMVVIQGLNGSSNGEFAQVLRTVATKYNVQVVLVNEVSRTLWRGLTGQRLTPIDLLNIEGLGLCYVDPRLPQQADVVVNAAICTARRQPRLFASVSKLRGITDSSLKGVIVDLSEDTVL